MFSFEVDIFLLDLHAHWLFRGLEVCSKAEIIISDALVSGVFGRPFDSFQAVVDYLDQVTHFWEYLWVECGESRSGGDHGLAFDVEAAAGLREILGGVVASSLESRLLQSVLARDAAGDGSWTFEKR